MKRDLFFILVAGFFLRLIGINFGLPLLTHADEPVVVNHAIAYGGGDFNPHFFNLPPLVSYFLFFVYGIYFLLGKILGIFTSQYDYLEKFLLSPSAWYILGRLVVGVILGTLSIYFLYKLAKDVFSEKVALGSALFFSFSYIHILHSHYIYADVPLVLAILWVAISSFKLYKNPSLKYYLIAGFLVGLSAAIKYNGLLTAIFVIFAHLLGWERKNILKPLGSIIFCLLGFLIFNPFALLDFSFFKKELLEQAQAEGFIGWWYHFRFSLAEGVGWPMLISGLAGLIFALFKEKKINLFLSSFPLLFSLSLGFFGQTHERYVLPVVPFLCIYASYLVDVIGSRRKILGKKLTYNLQLTTYYLIIFSAIIPNLAKSIWLDYVALQKDTRLLAKEWIEENIPAGSKIALDHTFFTPRLWSNREQLEEKLKQAKTKAQKIKIQILLNSKKYPKANYQIYYLWKKNKPEPEFLFARPLIDYDLKVLKQKGIEYLVVHRDIYREEKEKFLSKLGREAKLLKSFSPYFVSAKKCSQEKIVQTGLPFFGQELFSRKRPGYPIWIYVTK